MRRPNLLAVLIILLIIGKLEILFMQRLQRPGLADLYQWLLPLRLLPIAMREGGQCRLSLDDLREWRHYRVAHPTPGPPFIVDLHRYRHQGARLKFLQTAHR